MRLSNPFKSLLLAGLLAVAGAASAQKTQLLVYTALETDQLKAYQEASTRCNPTSRSSGSAIPPASSRPSCWPKRPIHRPTR